MKHIHFIGICGVGMSALAILWKKKGWKVTGSDAGFYPPVSTHLEQNQIDFYAGWHPEKMCQSASGNKCPDLVIVGNVASSENPEWLYVQKNNIPHLSYPELIAQNLVRENSIVCAGTWGKTSTSALLAYILKSANFKPTYMFGGLSLSLPYAADDEGGQWSVLEGDEYKTGKNRPEAKFFSYKPTHLLLSGLTWDHFDMYPTESSYYDAFNKLIKMIPKEGLVVACSDNENVNRVIDEIDTIRVVTYGSNDKANFIYHNVQLNKNGIQMKITHKDKTYEISSPMLGSYMAENICGAFAMAHKIGIEPEIITTAISHFGGIKRRLEKRGITQNGAVVFDDIAHSPAKSRSVLATLNNIFDGKIFAVFEPNTGNRQISSASSYDNAFTDADEVLIPRLTKIKIDENSQEAVMDGKKLLEIISSTHKNTRLVENDDELISYLKKSTGPNDAIVFLGSHGFRGMIEEVLK